MSFLPMTLETQLVGKAASLLPWLLQPNVTDILINGTESFYIEKEGEMISIPHPFPDSQSIFDLIERLLIANGKRIDAAVPYADGRMADGSRFHLVLPPIASNGPFISIRKLRDTSRISCESFGEGEVVSRVVEFFKTKKNILICGGTGSGKTTLLSCLLDMAEETERIAVIEETREVRSCHPHLVSLEARIASPEGRGQVSLRALVRNSLRMRPDRIVVGEVRGEEAFDLLQAMNTGHRGCLGTLHANSAIDGLKRLENLAILAGYGMSHQSVREWVAGTIEVVVFMGRVLDKRQILEIISVHGLEGERYRLLPLYKIASY